MEFHRESKKLLGNLTRSLTSIITGKQRRR
jgi:hypothetical protein